MSASPTNNFKVPKFTIIDSGPQGDNSCVFLSQKAMLDLSFEQGDIVHIYAFRGRKDTIAAVYMNPEFLCETSIQVNHIVRKNLAAQVGDVVRVKLYKEAVALQKLVLKKIGGLASCATSENHQQKFLSEYFGDYNRPVCRDDVFEIKTNLGNMEFMIAYTQPFIYGFVTAQTMIAIDWQNDQL